LRDDGIVMDDGTTSRLADAVVDDPTAKQQMLSTGVPADTAWQICVSRLSDDEWAHDSGPKARAILTAGILRGSTLSETALPRWGFAG
jgi:hypothetical protein